MNIIFSYIRVFVFLGCTLMGIQIPTFVDQYGKCLESHLTESQHALNEFQDNADKYFDGSLEKLIAHYKDNEDQVIIEGGRSIQSIYERHLVLKGKFEKFQSNSWSAYTQALFTPVPDIGKEVWENFSYAIKLRPEAIVFGLVMGLIFTAVIEIVLKFLLIAPKLLHKSIQPATDASLD